MTGKYADVIKKAREGQNSSTTAEDRHTGLPESQQAGLPEEQDRQDAIDYVNLSIRVPRFLRQHWVVEAKRTGTSLTQEIIVSLTEKFGRPK